MWSSACSSSSSSGSGSGGGGGGRGRGRLQQEQLGRAHVLHHSGKGQHLRTNNGKDFPPPPASDSAQIKGCLPQSTAGYYRIKSLTASDGGKTVTTVMSKPYSDWKSLFGAGYPLYPAHVAEKLSGATVGGAAHMTAATHFHEDCTVGRPSSPRASARRCSLTTWTHPSSG